MAYIVADSSAKHDQHVEKKQHHSLVHHAKKAVRFFARVFAAVCTCYAPSSKVKIERTGIEFDDLPPEVLMRVISHCDFSSQMNLRATSRRMYSLVEHSDLARRQVVGGVEIGSCIPSASHSSGYLPGLPQHIHPVQHSATLPSMSTSSLVRSPSSISSSSSSSSSSQHISIRRLSRTHGQIVLSLERFNGIMRRLCVCHSLHIRGISVDDSLAGRLLLAEYRAVRDLVLDRVSTASQAIIDKVVQKVAPTRSIYIFNHSHRMAASSISPSIVLQSVAAEIAIEACRGTGLIHSKFDDDSLKFIVTNDSIARRCIRLPLSAITHDGIIEAAKAFHSRCLLLIEEDPDNLPLWEILVTLPSSPLIHSSRVHVPPEMFAHCVIWSFSHLSFTLQVQVERMLLRISVDYGRGALHR